MSGVEGDPRRVRVGSSRTASLWLYGTIVIAGAGVVILGSILAWWVALIGVLCVVLGLTGALWARRGIANRVVAGLTQLPSPGIETELANRRAAQSELAAQVGASPLPAPGLRDTGRVVGVPLTGNWRPFVEALAERIQPHVPQGVELSGDDQRLVMTAPDEVRASDLAKILGDNSREPVARAVDAARKALGDVQEFVVRTTAGPWPGHAVSPPGSRALNSLVHLWYGDDDFPVLRLEPIPYSTDDKPRRAVR